MVWGIASAVGPVLGGVFVSNFIQPNDLYLHSSLVKKAILT